MGPAVSGPEIGTGINAGMKMNRLGKTVLCLAVLLMALSAASALAEAKLTFSPENPKMGEYVDVTVLPEREGALGVRYELSTSSGVVYKDVGSAEILFDFCDGFLGFFEGCYVAFIRLCLGAEGIQLL